MLVDFWKSLPEPTSDVTYCGWGESKQQEILRSLFLKPLTPGIVPGDIVDLRFVPPHLNPVSQLIEPEAENFFLGLVAPMGASKVRFLVW